LPENSAGSRGEECSCDTPIAVEESARLSDIRFWAALLLSVGLIKATLLILDHQPFFHLGDSAVYVRSAVTDQFPSDWSFAYGLIFIRAVLAAFGSLQAVVVVQSLMDAILALLLAAILDRIFGAPRWIAALAVILYAVEPISLLYERFMLTETVATFGFVLFLTVALVYLSKPRVMLLAAMAAISFVVVAARVSLLLAMAVVVVATPLLARFSTAPTADRWRSKLFVHPPVRLVHLAAVCALFVCSQILYAQWYHAVTGQPAGYNSADGLFLLAAWAPLVTPADFHDNDTGKDTLGRVRFSWRDRFSCPAHRFAPGGLIDTFVAVNGGEENQTVRRRIRSKS